MARIEKLQAVAAELTEAIGSGNAALVIGAGASAGSGAPLASDLVRLLQQAFPLAAIREAAGAATAMGSPGGAPTEPDAS